MSEFGGMFGMGPIPVEPSADHRESARQLASWFSALQGAGFSAEQAMLLMHATLEGAASGQAQAQAFIAWQERHDNG